MDGMTREELIARIEAGETGDELLCAIAREARWRFDEKDDCCVRTNEALDVASWLTSLDAAVSLITGYEWRVTDDGQAVVWYDGSVAGKWAGVTNNPAAALVAAWLKATA